MTKCKSERRSEIERWFRVREQEGLSLRVLSERSGIPVGTLSWWAHRLRHSEIAAGRFVAVQVVDRAEPEEGAAPAQGVEPEVRVHHPSGLCVELRGELAHVVCDQLALVISRWS